MPTPTIAHAPRPLSRAEADLLSQRLYAYSHHFEWWKEVSQVSAEILHKPGSAASTASGASTSQTQGTQIEGEKQ